MIIHRLSNNHRKISKLLVPLHRCLSKTFEDAKGYLNVAEVLNPEKQLAALEPTHVLQTPSSLLEQVPFLVEKALDLFQVSSGLSWPVVLIGFGVGVRLVCLPAHIVLEKRIMDRLPLIKIYKETIIAKIMRDTTLSLKKGKEMQCYRKEHGLPSPTRLVLYFIPATVLFGINYIAISKLVGCNYAPVLNSSFLWLPSLCLKDPHRLLSLVNSILVVMIARKFIRNSPDPGNLNSLLSKFGSFAIPTFIAMYVQAHLPSALLLYWLSSNITRFFINDNLLTLDFFRRAVGLVSYEEKVKLFASLPKSPEQQAVQIATQDVVPTTPDHTTPDPASSGNNELATLWIQGDLSTLREVLSSERTKHDQEINKLKEDIQFCDNELSNSGPLSGSLLKMQIKAEKRALEEQIKRAKDQSREFDFVERKLSIAERKQKNELITVPEDSNEVKTNLDDTYSELMECLKACEDELTNTLPSSKLQPYEKFMRRNELLELQKNLLRDLEFYEGEIIAFPKEDK